jgi:hypothetical protein
LAAGRAAAHEGPPAPQEPVTLAATPRAAVTLEGTYRLLHGDDFAHGTGRYHDYLEVGHSHYLLRFAHRPQLRSGELLRVKG